MAAGSDTATARAAHSVDAAVAHEASTQRRGFRLAPDLVACLRRFNGLRAATLQDFTDVQTQLHLGANKVKYEIRLQSTRRSCTLP